ncbi:hypothetical protein [Streptomyces sp. SID3343]|uniref:hypothetical protein n=1 Tax=Streptomyces sp. SID3343 TaxID=2690260 RepID=UPI0013697B13|nr:hypothetical protein [Streptomyces sp. SID3343]MYW05432.1 hypothetical protein [Streptomyces sp. SID3343]
MDVIAARRLFLLGKGARSLDVAKTQCRTCGKSLVKDRTLCDVAAGRCERCVDRALPDVDRRARAYTAAFLTRCDRFPLNDHHLATTAKEWPDSEVLLARYSVMSGALQDMEVVRAGSAPAFPGTAWQPRPATEEERRRDGAFDFPVYVEWSTKKADAGTGLPVFHGRSAVLTWRTACSCGRSGGKRRPGVRPTRRGGSSVRRARRVRPVDRS